jgi:2-polyprenyl-3-methyl-5-hydroxy-6-metoxy-1,4-benzoquinol methylase
MNSESVQADMYYSLIRPEILNKIPENTSKVLDVGCGFGNLGKKLKEMRKLEYYGVEFSESATIYLDKICDKYWIGDLEKLNIDELPMVDCLIAADILEHLENPWGILGKLVSKLESNGVAIISIPNVRNLNIIGKLLIKGTWEYEDSGILDRTHLRFFTRQSIISLITQSDLEIQTISSNIDNYGMLRRIITWPLRKLISDLEISQYIIVARKIS